MKNHKKSVQLYIQKAKLSTINPLFVKKSLTSKTRSPYSIPTVAKSTAGRGNPVLSAMANDNTPQACFFIRRSNTSKASHKWLDLSMMAFDGQGSPLTASLLAVFPPRQTLSPYIVENVSDSSYQPFKGLSAMIYLFLATDRYSNNHIEIVRTEAENSLQARLSLSPEWRLMAQEPLQAFQRFQETAFFPPLHTVCNRMGRLRTPTKAERAEMALFAALNALPSTANKKGA